jgi:hypothetical protein
MVNHPLHKAIGEKLAETFGKNVLRDPACGGGHKLQLFYDRPKSRETQLCNADIILLRNHKVKVVIEIEESTARLPALRACDNSFQTDRARYPDKYPARGGTPLARADYRRSSLVQVNSM